MTVTEQTINEMYEQLEPLYFFYDERYINWLQSEDNKDNPRDDMPVGVAFGDILLFDSQGNVQNQSIQLGIKYNMNEVTA